MSAAIRLEAAVLLSDAKIQFAATLVQRGAKTPSDVKGQKPWEHDAWRCTFRRENGTELVIPLRTGIGHRKNGPFGFDPTLRPHTLAWEAQEARKVPVPPNVADVLHSMALDDPRGEDFESWCCNYGYDTDSRKALASYLECQEQTSRATRFFNGDLWSSIQSAVENY